MSNARKLAVRLSTLDAVTANTWAGKVRYLLDFGQGSGPAPVTDGRRLAVMLTAPEVANVLSATPAASLDAGVLMALLATVSHLRGEPSRFAGVRRDDLAAVLERVEHQLTLDAG